MSSVAHNHSPTPEFGKSRGRGFWKSLDELAGKPEYRKFVEREFPERASELLDPVSRRSFLGVMASSMALAGVSGCKLLRRPEERLLAYGNQPENLIPGKPRYYATCMSLGQEVTGLLVESHEGRPTKIEGNPLHPASLGSSGILHQASLLNLYDPDRSQVPVKSGTESGESSWEAFWEEMKPIIQAHKQDGGSNLRFVSEYITSPSLAMVKQHVIETFPKAKWHTYEPVNQDNTLQGLRSATGRPVCPHYRFDAASVILSVECDFLGREINNLAYTHDFAAARDSGKSWINRLYVIESDYTLTGARADHRLKLKPSLLRMALWLVASELFEKRKIGLPGNGSKPFMALIRKNKRLAESAGHAKWIRAVCDDLLRKPQQGLVCVGRTQDPAIHALAHVINTALGALGRTVTYKACATFGFNQNPSNQVDSLRELSFAMYSGAVETLIILGANPVFTAPKDFQFDKAIKKVKHTVHLGLEADETAAACLWHLPRTHFLEEWSDGIAYDGTAAIAQPLIAPMYQSASMAEFLAGFSGFQQTRGYDIVRAYWKSKAEAGDFEGAWRTWVHDGVIKGSALPNIDVGVSYPGLVKTGAEQQAVFMKTQPGELELLFREHATLYDGRFANNGWLQELPEPMTRLTWDNAAVMSTRTAEQYGLRDDILLKDGSGLPLGRTYRPMVEITYHGRKLNLPAYILPGLSDDTVLLNFGHGRIRTGRVGMGTGFNVYSIQTGHDFYAGFDAGLKKLSSTYELANVQEHWSMEGRDLVRVINVNEPHHEHHGHGPHPSLWDEHTYEKGQQWGMTIDLNRCTGCGACVIACQAENNIPVVGKKQVALNREMHWIRMDRYFSGDTDNPRVVHQAIACHQCEMAPCETVCPVTATVHSSDGLNDMAYNRCVGTRYCANNCPYKVRRFNYFNFTNGYSATQMMMQNPDVTVRFRGVMEKCTYCVQRINEKRIAFKNRGIETVPDGEIIPACQQACPAAAIVFGNINDPKSRVAALKQHKRNYDLLAELNIRPRTSFLARLNNPNPALRSSSSHDVHKPHAANNTHHKES